MFESCRAHQKIATETPKAIVILRNYPLSVGRHQVRVHRERCLPASSGFENDSLGRTLRAVLPGVH
jgi:hypothetical protein